MTIFWKSTKLRSFWIQIISMIITGAFSGSTIGLWEFGTMMCSQCILVMLIQVIRDDPWSWSYLTDHDHDHDDNDYITVLILNDLIRPKKKTSLRFYWIRISQLGVETKSWTIVHWGAIVLSIGLYLGFGLIYNAVCYQCQGLTNPYLVMQVWRW